jgi:hypothetical protein
VLDKYSHPDTWLLECLSRVIDFYERDSSTTHAYLGSLADALNDQTDIDSRFLPHDIQLNILQDARNLARAEIVRKTLITPAADQTAHQDLRELVDRRVDNPLSQPSDDVHDSTEQFGFSGMSRAELAANLFDKPHASPSESEAWSAAWEGKTRSQYMFDETVKKLSDGKLETTLARFLIRQIPIATDALQRLDNTDFSLMVPKGFARVFMECHLNVAMGNFGTSVILCGVILERALQHILILDETLATCIKAAKRKGLLVAHNAYRADQIQLVRNQVVHGDIDFGRVTHDQAWNLVESTRGLIAELYKSELKPE